MRLSLFITAFFLAFLLFSCKKDNTDKNGDVVNMGWSFIPHNVTIIYDVDTVKIKGLVSDTVHWQVKDKWWYFFNVHPNNSIDYYKNRYYRRNETEAWSESPGLVTFLMTPDNQWCEEVNGILYVKLIHPVKEGLTWDGNAYNSLDVQEYTMIDVNKPFEINGNAFQTTLKVIESDKTTLISQDIAEDVYADQVGLVYYKKVHIVNLQSQLNKSGYITEWKVKSWNKE